MASNPLITRLGFGAWAENIVVNFLEDYTDIMLISEGQTSISKFAEYDLNAKWDGKQLSITVRAYVEGEGWQTLEQTIQYSK